MKRRIAIIVTAVTIILSNTAQAHAPLVPGEVCRRIPHGTVCTIYGRWHSIRCQTGYKVFPTGMGTSCVVRG